MNWKLIRQALEADTPILRERTGSSFILGRDRTVAIKCRSTYVSRKHCVIEFEGNSKWSIKDLGSLNGTFLNSERIKSGEKKELTENDIVGIGIGDLNDDRTNPNLYVFKWTKVGVGRIIQQNITSSSTSASAVHHPVKRVVRRKKRSSKTSRLADAKRIRMAVNTNTSSSSSANEEDEPNDLLKSCQICMEPFAQLKKLGRPLHSTLCGHIFCYSCIQGSLKVKDYCPVCRTKVNPNSTHRIFI